MQNELKPCPFCGYHAVLSLYRVRKGYEGEVECNQCAAAIRTITIDTPEEAVKEVIEAWNRRTPEIVNVETSFYDKEEIHENCKVQVLTNTKTGEVSVGWWKNDD